MEGSTGERGGGSFMPSSSSAAIRRDSLTLSPSSSSSLPSLQVTTGLPARSTPQQPWCSRPPTVCRARFPALGSSWRHRSVIRYTVPLGCGCVPSSSACALLAASARTTSTSAHTLRRPPEALVSGGTGTRRIDEEQAIAEPCTERARGAGRLGADATRNAAPLHLTSSVERRRMHWACCDHLGVLHWVCMQR